MKEKIVGIMGAMPEEIEGVISLLSDRQELSMGMRTYYSGKINGIKTVVVFSRWGKVAAAATVSNLVLGFGISELIFTGVAGAISNKLRIGDIVIARRLIQHDMDARPIMKRYEVPLLGQTFIESSPDQLSIAAKAVSTLLESRHLHETIAGEALQQFGITDPQLLVGDIASGDQFFSSHRQKTDLQVQLPSILCVEMEGAAVAQVCYEYGIPFTIIRTISDAADEQSHIDFPAFLSQVSSKYSVAIIKNIYA
jgi:adenosylhomocysteine nucleosidase